MKVILLEDVKALGKKDEIVEINDGYARNFILPKKKGIEATSRNLNDLKLKKTNEDRLAAEKLAQAKEFAKEIETKQITVAIKTGSDGRAFGSVSTKEIAQEAKEQLGYDLDKKKMQLDVPVKREGTYNVTIKLHPQVSATLKVNVKGM